MSAGELGALLASIAAKPPSAQTDAAVKRLTQLLCRAAPGKENCSGEELRTAALQALKAAQARLGEAGADASVATQHAALGRAALAALEACPGAASAASLVPLHYNFVKRLVAARSYETAWAEATALHARLAGNGSTAGTAAALPRTAEAANVAVGAVLMLLLCCVDSPALGGAKLLEALQAAQSLEPWLGVLPPAEAEKHRDALFKYMYKAAAQLLERREHGQVAAVVAAMAAVAASEPHRHRVLQAGVKFSAHLPDGAVLEVAVALAAALLDSDNSLSDVLSLELVGLLCTACQRAGAAAAAAAPAAAPAAFSSDAWATLVQCGSSPSPVLQQAALLVPCLAMRRGSSGAQPAGWVQPVSLALAAARASAAALHQHLANPSLPPEQVQRHALVLAAAWQPANLLRKALAPDPGAAYHQLGSSDAVAAATQQLELLSVLVCTAHAAGAAGLEGGAAAAQLGVLAKQGHAAAVGLATAAKLRGAHGGEQLVPVVSADVAAALLGWDFQAYCLSGDQLPQPGLLSEQELSWLVAALYNVGVDLHSAGQFGAAVPPLLAAVSASMCCLMEVLLAGSDEQVVQQRAHDVAKRCTALSDVQLRAGDAAAAASTLTHGVAALVQCGLGVAAWQELLGSLARQSLDTLLAQHEQQQADGGGSREPAPKGKGTRAAKRPAARGKAAAATPSSTSSGSSEGSLVQRSCTGILASQYSAALPIAARAAVAEQELRTWAALASRGDSAAAAAHCSQLCSFLLEQAFPSEECPVGHALVLLAAHEAGLPAGALAGPALLAQAASVLEGAAQEDGVASALAGRVYGLSALAAAQQLVEQSVAEQRQQRQHSHAQASTSGSVAAPDVAEVQGLPSSPSLEAWQPVAAQVEAAMEHLEAAVEEAGARDEPQHHVDWEALAHLVAELGFMAALQGRAELEARCQQLCLDILTLVQASPDSQLMRWAATTPAGSWLCSCRFPGLRAAMAQRLTEPEACLEAWPASLAALHSAGLEAATGSEQPALAALVSSLQQLAAGPRDAGSALQRACLHRLAAEQEASTGNLVSALYHATEAHRLAFSLGSAGAQQQHSAAAGMGWWQRAAEQLCSLMQLGRLFEASGMADEALHALKEGLRMAASIGSAALAASFRIELANIYANQGSVAAQQVLAPVSSLMQTAQGSEGLKIYLRAQELVVQARLSVAASEHSAASEAYQAAGDLCRQADTADPVLASHVSALQGAALFGQAQCLGGQGGDAQAAARLALEAVEVLGGEAARCCSSSLQPRVAGLVFLALQEAEQPQQQGACLWGLQPGPASSRAPTEPRASSSSSRAAPAVKKPAGRGGARGKAAAAAKEVPAATGDASSCVDHSLAAQRLWLAYWLTREIPHVHRLVAAHLASECGRAGYAHLAALLLHTSLGATMRQQYRLVLHTKLQQLQRAGRAAGADVEQQRSVLQAALSQLGEPLEEVLVCQLAGQGAAVPALPASQAAKGRRRAAAPAAPNPAPAQDLLAALDQQAEAALRRWMAALPEGTVVCSLGSAPSSSSSGSSRDPGGASEHLVISRLATGSAPVILQLPAPEALAAGAAQHPIRALSLDPEDSAARSSSSRHHPLAEDMLRLLEDSGRSMRELATDTKEQQREWWRERVALDDRLAALLQSMGAEWLSGWRCLLLGAATGSQGREANVEHIMQQLQAQLADSSRPELTQQQLGIVRAAVSGLMEGSSSSGLSAVELQATCGQLSSCLGLDLSPERVAALLCSGECLGTGGGSSSSAGVAEAPEAPGSSRAAAAAAGTAAKPAARGRRAKTVTFQVEEEVQPEPLQPRGRRGQQQQPQQQQAPARAQRMSVRSSKAAAAAMGAVTPAPLAPYAAEAEGKGAGCSPPATTTGGEAGGLSANLCDVFDAMSLEPAAERSSRALTTARAIKHRSRLRMMQASTPGPAPSSSRAGGDLSTSTARGAATTPRMRAARTRPVPAAAGGAEEGEGPKASSSSSSSQEPQRGPVLLVLDGALQALPWESVPGLRSQRIYRTPSLACAAASAERSLREVDLSSTFYSLNPSGDLGSTQSTFQNWFARLPWEGKAGEPPTAAELAAALQSHQLFVYFGHGGGDQYIPAGTLRALDSCSAALLMGCSSGRLRLRGAHYEPSGPVLAYLLAGCPTAVANLWDVTDRDIDRFSQALLSAWLDKAGAAGRGGGLVGAAGGVAVAAGGAAAAVASGGPSGVPTPVKIDISSAVAASRAACKLPHLIGAAPVCYGLPTSVQ